MDEMVKIKTKIGRKFVFLIAVVFVNYNSIIQKNEKVTDFGNFIFEEQFTPPYPLYVRLDLA